jgi:hypothetical protein
MARVRYLGPEQVSVPELGRTVEPDQIVEVPDERFEGYACQPSNWEVVEEPKSRTSAAPPSHAEAHKGLAKKTAAKSAPQKEEG